MMNILYLFYILCQTIYKLETNYNKKFENIYIIEVCKLYAQYTYVIRTIIKLLLSLKNLLKNKSNTHEFSKLYHVHLLRSNKNSTLKHYKILRASLFVLKTLLAMYKQCSSSALCSRSCWLLWDSGSPDRAYDVLRPRQH